MHFPSESHLMFALVIIVAAVLKAHVNQRAVTTAAFGHVISNEWSQPLHSSTPSPPQPSPPQ